MHLEPLHAPGGHRSEISKWASIGLVAVILIFVAVASRSARRPSAARRRRTLDATGLFN
jgi:hypothetical protein